MDLETYVLCILAHGYGRTEGMEAMRNVVAAELGKRVAGVTPEQTEER